MAEVEELTWMPYGTERRQQSRQDALARTDSTTDAPPSLRLRIDDYDLGRFLRLAAGFSPSRHRYVVTPNVDHLIRLHDDPIFRTLYASAGYVLLDSRVLATLVKLTKGLDLPVCAGSDLTARLFETVIQPDDPIVLIGGDAAQVEILRRRYGLIHLAHHQPPMGLIHDKAAVETCLQFVEAHSPFRFCLLAVGSPQQEALAWMLQQRDIARGLTLCVGASIDFITGAEQRAPRWMQRCGLEWSYRLLQAPRRLARRYLLRGPRVLSLLKRTDVLLRRAPVLRATDASSPAAWRNGPVGKGNASPHTRRVPTPD